MRIKKTLVWLLLIQICLSIFIQLFSIKVVETVLSLTTIVFIILLYRIVSKLTIVLSTMLLVCGVSLYVRAGSSWLHFSDEFVGIGNVVTFLALVPLLTILIECFPLDKKQTQMLAHQHFYANAQTLTSFLCSGLNLGGISIVHSTFNPFLSDKQKELLTQSISRGFSLTMAWSPIGVGLALVVELLNLRLMEMMIMMLCVSIGLMYLDQSITMRKRKVQVDVALMLKLLLGNRRLFFWLGIFPLLIIVLNFLFQMSPVFLLTSCMLPYLFFLGFLYQRQAFVWSRIRSHFQTNGLKMADHFLIILSSSFLVKVMTIPSNDSSLNHFFTNVGKAIHTDILFVMMMLAMLFLSIVGIHIFVLYSLFMTVFPPAFFGISSYLYGFEMLMLLIIITMISPYNGTNALLSTITSKKSTQLVKLNMPYAAGVLLLSFTVFFLFSHV